VGGKGRTGTVIAAYLLYSGIFVDPQEALDFFASRRSTIKRGVTQPSQQRYVNYFRDVLSFKSAPYPVTLCLQRIIFRSVPRFCTAKSHLKKSSFRLSQRSSSPVNSTIPGTEGCKPCIEIWTTFGDHRYQSKLVYSTPPLSDGSYEFYESQEGRSIGWTLEGVFLFGDITIKVSHRGQKGKKSLKMFRCAFHTAFIDTDQLCLIFDSSKLDDLHKHQENYDDDFQMMLVFALPQTIDPDFKEVSFPDRFEVYAKIFENMSAHVLAPPSPSTPQYRRYWSVQPSTQQLSESHNIPALSESPNIQPLSESPNIQPPSESPN